MFSAPGRSPDSLSTSDYSSIYRSTYCARLLWQFSRNSPWRHLIAPPLQTVRGEPNGEGGRVFGFGRKHGEA